MRCENFQVCLEAIRQLRYAEHTTGPLETPIDTPAFALETADRMLSAFFPNLSLIPTDDASRCAACPFNTPYVSAKR